MRDPEELLFEQPIQYRGAGGTGMLRSVEQAIDCCGETGQADLAQALEHAKDILHMARDTRSRPAVAAAREVVMHALADADLLHP